MTKALRVFGARPRLATVLTITLTAGAVAGCVVEPPPRRGEVVVTTSAPPPPRAEYQPPPPTERAVWDPGHWNWNGREYAWQPGHYIERPNPVARWEAGRWVAQNGRWVWVEGAWR